MGNKQPSFRIGLQLQDSKNEAEAGQVLEGRVYLSVAKQSHLSHVEGIHLLLQGWEQSAVRKGGSSSHHNTSSSSSHRSSASATTSSTPVHTATSTIAKIDHAIVKVSEIKVGQYEYVFRWRLPEHLPSSMRCQSKDYSSSFCEIRYTLTAYLAGAATTKHTGKREEANTLPSSSVTLVVFATPPSSHEALQLHRPIYAQLQDYPISTCWFWSKGKLCMGWQVADGNLSCPGDVVNVEVFGSNQSRTSVQYFIVKCMETVQWKLEQTGENARASDSRSMACTRTLCEQRLSTDYCANWQAKSGYGLLSGSSHTNSNSNNDYHHAPNAPLRTQLVIPTDAHDYYSGRLLTVRHTLVVTACMKGWATSSPESASELIMMRKLPPIIPAATSASFATNPDILEAHVVDTITSGPVVDDPIAIPMAQAFLINDELQAAHALGVTPSAPDESLDFSSASNAAYSDVAFSSRPYSDYPQPDMQQLETLIRESPGSLSVLLDGDDDSWKMLVRNLSPRDYCRLVQVATASNANDGAAASMTSVAKDLAQCMGHKLECRHLLACLYTLDEDERCQVLKIVGPMVSDLAEHRRTIEQELNPRELELFQSALTKIHEISRILYIHVMIAASS
ncbi:hypothetical protein MPSEU_000156500 [Mayamaea pseudoterrestris]|nr:hypothetical protein MPSEU_000156500 [Mayamaea pseudoterrestris]